ncbi:MAG: hypothetical protein H6721_03825 [Sandaracinus sp.]|nr:hypothetical protein [Sandaracinus sp.]MCB9612303.1 hypothetical protein [Sandaracinus sp.]MCB9631258.1 hypothetical protein [Sandaracinus sp.]
MRWWSFVLLVACGGSEPVDPTPRPDADVLRFDAAMLTPTPDAGGRIPLDGGTEDDAGPETPRWMCNLGRPGTTLGGVVTSYPNIEVRSEPRFRARAAGYSVKRDSRGPLLLVLLEIENVTSESYCGLIPESYLDDVELVGLVETPAHFQTDFTSTVTSDCLPPGGRGIYDAVARGVDLIDLEEGRLLTFRSRSELNAPSVLAAPPRLNVATTRLDDGWAVAGTLTPVQTIRNYGLRVYARDARGIPYARLLAYPGELANLYAGTPYDVQSETTICEPASFDAYQSWIDDSRRALSTARPQPHRAALEELRRRRQALIDPL